MNMLKFDPRCDFNSSNSIFGHSFTATEHCAAGRVAILARDAAAAWSQKSAPIQRECMFSVYILKLNVMSVSTRYLRHVDVAVAEWCGRARGLILIDFSKARMRRITLPNYPREERARRRRAAERSCSPSPPLSQSHTLPLGAEGLV